LGRRALATLFLLVAAGFPVQAQQASSLADAARQARAQKQTQPKADNSQAQQIADQLAEDQEDRNAPAGFKTYNAGDYRLWIPAPYTIDGHDDGGIVLSAAPVGSTQPLIFVGNPVVLQSGKNDDAFADASTQLARAYSQSAKCAKTILANYSAYQCTLAGASLLGRSVSGNAVFVRGSNKIIPVFCVAPTSSRERDTLNDAHASDQPKRDAQESLTRADQGARDIWQKCDAVLKSIHLNEDPGQQTETSKAVTAAKPIATQQVVAQTEEMPAPAASGAPTGNTGGPASLADIARQLHQSPAQAVKAPPAAQSPVVQNVVPSGFKAHAFNYCKSPTQCWNASVIVPDTAQLVNSDCKRYVFEVKVQGAPFLLLAGAGSDSCDGHSASDPTLVHWNQLVDPESKRAPGTFVTISSQQTMLEGRPANITTMGFKKGMSDWMGKRAEVEANGVHLVVGCMAPREYFSDGDAVCSALIGSLRLP